MKPAIILFVLAIASVAAAATLEVTWEIGEGPKQSSNVKVSEVRGYRFENLTSMPIKSFRIHTDLE